MLIFFADPESFRIEVGVSAGAPSLPLPEMVSSVNSAQQPLFFKKPWSKQPMALVAEPTEEGARLVPLDRRSAATRSKKLSESPEVTLLAPLGAIAIRGVVPEHQLVRQIKGGLLAGYIALDFAVDSPVGVLTSHDVDALEEFLALCWSATLTRDHLRLFANERAAREEFISEILHRVRRVANPLLAFASQLKRAQAAGDRLKVARSLDQLGTLPVDDIGMYLSRLESHIGERAPIDIDVDDLVREIVAGFNASYLQRVQVRGASRCQVVAFRSELEFCVEELLLNAQKYGARAVPISVELSKVRRRQPEKRWIGEALCRISVTSGGGIPRAFKNTVFDAGQRVRRAGSQGQWASETADPGRGMGLYLVKRYVEQHYGGSVWEDGDASIARFVIELGAVEQGARS